MSFEMNRMPRKSTLGTHGIQPIRINLSPMMRSPMGNGTSPKPKRTCATRLSPLLGSSKRTKRVSPIKVGDLSDFSYFLSSKKKPKPRTPTVNASFKSRRCLYKDSDVNSSSRATSVQVPNSRRTLGPQKASEVKFTRPAQPTKIPLPGNLNKNQKSTSSKKPVSSIPHAVPYKKIPKSCAATSEPNQNILSVLQTESLEQIIQQVKTVAAEQKTMFAEAKVMIGQVGQMLQEQRNILNEMRQIQDIHQKLFQTQEIISLEREIEKDCEAKAASSLVNSTEEEGDSGTVLNFSDKENSTHRQSRKSVVAYKEMRKSFRCLNTPVHSSKKSKTPKVKTPRSALSAKVKAQLESLLDE